METPWWRRSVSNKPELAREVFSQLGAENISLPAAIIWAITVNATLKPDDAAGTFI